MEFKEAQMQITASAFFDRLRQQGIVPANQKEAADLFQIGDALVAANALTDPEDQPSRVGQAKEALLHVLKSEEDSSTTDLDTYCSKQARDILNHNNEISEAVLRGMTESAE